MAWKNKWSKSLVEEYFDKKDINYLSDEEHSLLAIECNTKHYEVTMVIEIYEEAYDINAFWMIEFNQLEDKLKMLELNNLINSNVTNEITYISKAYYENVETGEMSTEPTCIIVNVKMRNTRCNNILGDIQHMELFIEKYVKAVKLVLSGCEVETAYEIMESI